MIPNTLPSSMTKRFKKVYIEISNVCNLQCSFCPEVIRGKEFMKPDMFQKVVTAVAPLTEEVCFHLMGEPLLHPQFDAYVRFCETLGLPVNVTTNGLLLSDDRIPALINPIMKQINFSLQSFEDNFPDKDNSLYLQRTLDFTKRALRERPNLYINYRLWNVGAKGYQTSNDSLLDKISQGLGVDFRRETDVRRKKSIRIKGRLSLHFDSRFEWPDPRHPIRSDRGFCYGLSSHIGILTDGTVVPCCLDKEGIISLGSCGIQTIDDILQSARAIAMQKGFQAGILVEDLCQKCTFIARFDGKVKRYEKEKQFSTPDSLSIH